MACRNEKLLIERRMSWREKNLLYLGPGLLGGIAFGDWLTMLRKNRYRIDAPYWLRAAIITLYSLGNSPLRRREEKKFGSQFREATVREPLFILGIWRSGTTHLQNLLALDDRFAYPNLYQVLNPHTFLTTEAQRAKLMAKGLPKRRPQDSVSMSFESPSEEEFALCAATGHSFLMGTIFPREWEHYGRYLTLRDVPAAEISAWKAAYREFLQKLTWKYQRPLVLKSPGHTCRIKLLLEMFPDAKFVHIYRNPYTVFRSTQHTTRVLLRHWALQRPQGMERLDDLIIKQYTELYDAYFEERSLIPADRLHEVRYEDLDRDPVGQMRGLYEALRLPDFSHVEQPLRKYLSSLGEFKKNPHQPLPDELRQRLASEWKREFETWGYEV